MGINDDLCGTCDTNKQITFQTTMLNLHLCDYSDGYTLAKEAITVAEAVADSQNKIKKIFKICAQFTDCIYKINNIKRG